MQKGCGGDTMKLAADSDADVHQVGGELSKGAAHRLHVMAAAALPSLSSTCPLPASCPHPSFPLCPLPLFPGGHRPTASSRTSAASCATTRAPSPSCTAASSWTRSTARGFAHRDAGTGGLLACILSKLYGVGPSHVPAIYLLNTGPPSLSGEPPLPPLLSKRVLHWHPLLPAGPFHTHTDTPPSRLAPPTTANAASTSPSTSRPRTVTPSWPSSRTCCWPLWTWCSAMAPSSPLPGPWWVWESGKVVSEQCLRVPKGHRKHGHVGVPRVVWLCKDGVAGVSCNAIHVGVGFAPVGVQWGCPSRSDSTSSHSMMQKPTSPLAPHTPLAGCCCAGGDGT